MEEFKYKLGLEAKCKLTGFTGIIRYRVQYLTGCNVYGIQAPATLDGKIPDAVGVDENCITIIGEGISKSFYEEGNEESVPRSEKPGGPQTAVPSSPNSL